MVVLMPFGLRGRDKGRRREACKGICLGIGRSPRHFQAFPKSMHLSTTRQPATHFLNSGPPSSFIIAVPAITITIAPSLFLHQRVSPLRDFHNLYDDHEKTPFLPIHFRKSSLHLPTMSAQRRRSRQSPRTNTVRA